ncbi:hypothetical protein ACUXST_001624 [Sphingomonas sp. F9_3S_D5_B_2]
MAKLHDEWVVAPHGPLREIEPGLLTVVGEIKMPLGAFPRRMTVIALERGGTALYSPIPLREPDMKRIEALGEPAYLIVPNPAHRLDIRAFHHRYPRAKVVTAPGAKSRVEEAVKPAQTSARLGKSASLIVVAGTGEREVALLVGGERSSLITNDIIGNVRSPRGIGGWLINRILRFGPKPHVPRDVRGLLINDKEALATQFRLWAEIEGLERIIPSHGEIIADPGPVLRRLADELD